MRRLTDFLMVLTVILLIPAGQVLAKFGALSDRGGMLGISGFNILLAGSYMLFLTRGALWAWVLRRNPVSRVYPYLSLAYPLVFATGILIFNEPVSLGKALGTILIISGSLLLTGGNPVERT